LHADNLNAFNSFDEPEKLLPKVFAPRIESGKLIAEMLPLSEATLQVEI